METVPVDRRTGTLEMVLHIYDNRVVLADVHHRTRELPVDGQYAALRTIGRYALGMKAVGPHTATTVPAGPRNSFTIRLKPVQFPIWS